MIINDNIHNIYVKERSRSCKMAELEPIEGQNLMKMAISQKRLFEIPL